MSDKSYTVVRLDSSTIVQQAMLYKSVFGVKKDDDSCIAFWTKKHYQNPMGESFIFGVFIDDNLAGLNAYLPTMYKVNNEDIFALQSCESCVNPAYQGRGIWGSIVKHAVEYIFSETKYQVIMGFPNYRNSFPGFKKMNWEVLSNMNNLIMINNSKAFARTVIGHNKLIECCSFPIKLQKIACAFHKRYKVEECSSSDLIWNTTQGYISLVPQRDWLEWKMDYKGLSSVAVRQGEKVVATCIYSLDTYNDEQIVKLENISILPEYSDKANGILSSVTRYLSSQYPKSAFIRVWVQAGDLRLKNYQNLLFLKSSHPNPFIIKQPKQDLSKYSWLLSFFDLD